VTIPSDAGFCNGTLAEAGLPCVQRNGQESNMKLLILIIGFCVLFVLCWPLAVLALVLFPILWLISLPLRLIGITFEAIFALFRALLLLPARLLGYRPRRCNC
jgi:hypothetical protein